MIRALVVVLFLSLTGYYFLPFRTPVPGFTTFTLGKLAALGLVAVAVVTGSLRVSGPLLKAYAPLLALAVWLPLASVFHAVTPWADAKLLLGHTLAAVAGVVAARALADAGFRGRIVRVVVLVGLAPILAALVEPYAPAWTDAFWRMFLPESGAAVHSDFGGIFRVRGTFSAPPELANFLVGWFPLAAVWLATGGGPGLRPKLPVLLATVAAAAALTLTLTRSSMLGAGAGAACALLLLLIVGRVRSPKRAPNRYGRALLLLVAAGLLAGPVVLFLRGRLTAFAMSSALCLGLVLLLLAAFASPRARSRVPRSAAAWVAALALLIVGAPLLGFGWLAPAHPLTAAGAWTPEGPQPVTAAGRLVETAAHAGWQRQKLWRVALWMLPDSPVAGPGWYAYAETVQHDGSLKARFDLDPARGDIDAGVDNPHNLSLTALTTGGVIALGLLLHALLVLVRSSLRRALDPSRAPFERALGAGMLWYWCAFAAMGVVGQDVFTIGGALTFHTWAALTLADGRNVTSSPGKRRR